MFRKLFKHDAATLTVYVDDMPIQAEPGETVAAVLLRHPELWARSTPVTQSRRGPYCMMGVCFDCLAVVDGVASIQTCLTAVGDGMRISRQIGTRRID